MDITFKQRCLKLLKSFQVALVLNDEKVKECVKADYEKSKDKAMIKFFKNGNKEKLKLVLKKVYKCQDVEQMSDTELTFCYIAKTLESLENFCEIAENANELYNNILKIEKALKHANTFDEFKSFCLEDCYDIGKHANAAGCTPKEPVNTENKTPKEEPTMDGLAEFNLEAYKEEVEADVNKAIRSLYCY